jgi:hypothetical protein
VEARAISEKFPPSSLEATPRTHFIPSIDQPTTINFDNGNTVGSILFSHPQFTLSHERPPKMSTTVAVAVSKAQKGTTGPKLASALPRSLCKGPVYAQGKLRNQNSNAAKKARADQAKRLEKYLENASLGKDIFVWNHIQTNQVVYSLTRRLNVSVLVNWV